MRRMRFMNRVWLVLLVAAGCSPQLAAQESKPRPASDFLDSRQGVTQEELVTRAIASNPMLAGQREQIEMAKGDVTQARLRKNPSAMLGGLKEVDGDDHGTSVAASLPLELYGRRSRRTAVAEKKEDVSKQGVADR